MKNVLAVFVSLIMLFALAVPAFAVEKGQAFEGTPVIDGKVDELWENAVSHPINKLKDGEATNLIADFKLLWDSKYLYLLINVSDPEISYEGDSSSTKDGVEIYLDPMLVRTDNYTAEPLVMQAFIPAPAEASMLFEGEPTSMESFATGAKKAFVLTEKGYIVEAQIDLTTICPNIKMQAGTVIGLDIQANDQVTGDTARAGAYGWSDDSNLAWQTSSVLGEVTFIAAPTPASPEDDSDNPGTSDSAIEFLLYLSISSLSIISIIFLKRKNSI
ncbi:MAG: LPXTG-motif cell wall anchor domain protein [Clostridia bacterium]|nr:LPXTG-motif cell wall anchor domain protein [Clostridia bacterium]